MSAATLYSVEATVTLAEVNAGKVIIAGVAGKQIVVVGMLFTWIGSWGSPGTGIMRILATGSTAIFDILDTEFTAGYVTETHNNGDVIIGAGFLAALTAGLGVSVSKVGGDLTGGTSVLVRLLYRLA